MRISLLPVLSQTQAHASYDTTSRMTHKKLQGAGAQAPLCPTLSSASPGGRLATADPNTPLSRP